MLRAGILHWWEGPSSHVHHIQAYIYTPFTPAHARERLRDAKTVLAIEAPKDAEGSQWLQALRVAV